jgi:uncharacterized membrane protein
MSKVKNSKQSAKPNYVRIGGFLKEIVTVHDEQGNILQKLIKPVMVEFYSRDVIQVLVGSILLAVPVGLTEEVWVLGETLPSLNILLITVLSMCAVAIFVYHNFYLGHFKNHKIEFFKRALSVYVISFCVAGLFLTLIGKAPWTLDWALALKRSIIVGLPASMSAAVADMIK